MEFTILELFLILYVANLILDYPLQDEFLKKYKCQSNYALFVHCMIWAGGLAIVLMPLGLFAWWKFGMLLVGHYCIDYWKCRGLYKMWPYMLKTKYVKTEDTAGYEYIRVPMISDWGSLYIDQSLHVGQVLLCLL